jgi:STE24 endopeptidase
LSQRLLGLCQRTGIAALGVFRCDLGAETRKANAALAGIGKTRRVLLSDTLLADFPPDEIEGVLAHELAHHRYRHILKGLALASIGSLFSFYLTDAAAARWIAWFELDGLADPAGMPFLVLWLSILNFASQPVQNGISRIFEWEADRFAVAFSASPKTFASALRRLGELNLADPSPPAWIEWFFYDHPAINRRIAAAEKASS